MRRIKRMPVLFRMLWLLAAMTVLLSGCAVDTPQSQPVISLDEIPAFGDTPYVELDGNQPDFTEEEKAAAEAFEEYSALDSLGRCGTAFACVGEELMPTEERESISQVKPSGWQTAEYDFVDGKYLYNRCHLIGFQLTGENANEENLITGTRYLNVEGMLPFENMVADYIKETGNHVLYRVTPVFEGENLVASGVVMEGWSVEDDGAGICYRVYVYNNQPGVEIDYRTGESQAAAEGGAGDTGEEAASSTSSAEEATYILNTSSHKFHLPDCPSVETMKEENRETYQGTRDALLQMGYEPCGSCKP